MGDRQVTRTNDCGTNSGCDEDNNLTLTGICTEGDRQNGRRGKCNNGGSDDNYIYFGGTERDNQSGDSGGDRRYEGGSRVTLRSGDTFWKLAEEKYGGKHPIEAIYAANGLYPKTSEKDGKLEMTDPTYYAGKSYVLPDEKDLGRLTKQYRQHVEEQGRSSQKRVGTGEEESSVKLIYGDTFERMARAKYGHEVPGAAFYEANGLTGKVVNGCEKDPIYYAGKTYKLPAEKDIPELCRKYYERIGHPELCPEEYRCNKNDDRGGDNYGYDGETDRDRGGDCPPKTREDGNYGYDGETDRDRGGRGDGGREQPGDREYNEGYEDGYRDAMRKQCQCGGGGCGSCQPQKYNADGTRTREYDDWARQQADAEANTTRTYYDDAEQQRWNDYQQQRRGMCGCGGAGCDRCSGRRQQQGCQNCGGGGCESCYDTEYGPRRPRVRY